MSNATPLTPDNFHTVSLDQPDLPDWAWSRFADGYLVTDLELDNRPVLQAGDVIVDVLRNEAGGVVRGPVVYRAAAGDYYRAAHDGERFASWEPLDATRLDDAFTEARRELPDAVSGRLRHSYGPWRVSGCLGSPVMTILAGGKDAGLPVAGVSGASLSRDYPVDNAVLIAAAPALYAALGALCDALDRYEDHVQPGTATAYRRARSALAQILVDRDSIGGA